MEDLMNYYIRLVPFWGSFWKSFEAVLDCRTESVGYIPIISATQRGCPDGCDAKKMVSKGEMEETGIT